MMAAAPRLRTFRRIVVAVDSSAHGRAAMEAAVDLAARLHSEIEGLLVEDIDLVRLAELPVGREIEFPSGRAREFSLTVMQDRFRLEELQTRRAFNAATGRSQLHGTFRVVRGRVEAEVMSAAGGADLLILGMASGSFGGGRQPGALALSAVQRAPKSVLLLRPGARLSGNAMVYFDGSPGAEQALDVAAAVASGRDDTLTVLVVADSPDRAAALRAQARDRIGAATPQPRFFDTPPPKADDICRLAGQAGADVFVVSSASLTLDDTARTRLLQDLCCPILLVR